MRLPQMKTLVNTALGVAFVGTGALMYMQTKQLEDISNSDFFKEAFTILRAHDGLFIRLLIAKEFTSFI